MSTLDQLIDTLQAGDSISVKFVRPDEEGSTKFQF